MVHHRNQDESSSGSSPKNAGAEKSTTTETAASKLKQALPKRGVSSQQQHNKNTFFAGMDADCDRPACDDVVSQMQQMMKTTTNPKNNNNDTRKTTTKEASSSSNPPPTGVACPPTSSQLGHASWTLLHSMAAWYPNHPSPQDQEQMTHFFQALAQFYPCTWCAHDFQQNLQKEPVRTESRTALCQWLCQQHNHVNAKLGKPLFSCDMPSLDERWRKSSNPQCYQQK